MPSLLPRIKKQYAVTLTLLAVIYAAVVVCSGFTADPQAVKDPARDSTYAGAATCISCHKTVYDSVTATAHFHTSRPGAAEFVKGSFDSTKNSFVYNPFVTVKMEQKDAGIFQTVYINGESTHSESMDIIIGSGKKGQTFLYWKDGLIYQLPVSYYVPAASWCNSPGYPSNLPRFNRIIPGRCLECHGSRAKVEDAGNRIEYVEKSSIVYGVDCERCHGPANAHVTYHTAHPGEKTGRYILLEKTLTRQQNLDRCALCHSGIRTPVKPVFSYVAGDRLEDFSLPKYHPDSAGSLDVHGNQYGLLTSSKCFQKSGMTCASCHAAHKTEVNQTAVFSQRCINCHNAKEQPECKVKPTAGLVLADNCIDCHMPLQPSRAIFLQMADAAKSTADLVRSHRIAVYSGATKDFLKSRKLRHVL